MARIAWILVILFATGRAAAQEPELPVKKLTVSPAAAPVPALRYTLLPELRDTAPGNAALLYYRAFSPDLISGWLRPDMNEAVEKALTAPLAELKPRSGTDPLRQAGSLRDTGVLREVDRAARRQYCDWDLAGRAREEGISLLLPDAQGLRHFGRLLAVRA